MDTPIKKIAFITGSTSGIGKATAKIFAKNGYNLILTGRRKERLEEIKQQLEGKYGIQIITLCFDIRDNAATKKAFKSNKTSLYIDLGARNLPIRLLLLLKTPQKS